MTEFSRKDANFTFKFRILCLDSHSYIGSHSNNTSDVQLNLVYHLGLSNAKARKLSIM